MYRIELKGSQTAFCTELNLTVTRKKHGVIDALARLMVQHGADRNGLVEVYRGDTICFHARPLAQWADYRLTEGDDEGFRVRLHSQDHRFELEA